MKRTLLSITLLIILNIGYSQQKPEEYSAGNKENFDSFLLKFSTDSIFQVSRIKFPLEFKTLDYDTFKELKKTINKKDWRMDNIFMNEEKVSQIYDNFSLNIKDTDERVFRWVGVENGINVLYFFKRIEGKWYLIKFEDTST
jgi:hypothetical protein